MRRLYRYPDQGYIGGVCHGFGEYTGIDPIIWRVLTVFTGLLSFILFFGFLFPKYPLKVSATIESI